MWIPTSEVLECELVEHLVLESCGREALEMGVLKLVKPHLAAGEHSYWRADTMVHECFSSKHLLLQNAED